MTQTPDEGDNKPLEETELNLGSNDDQGDTDTGINLDFADFSDDDAKSGAELNLGPLPTEEGEADKAEPAADQDAEKPDEPDEKAPSQEDEAVAKALEELHDDLVVKPGEWYVVHTYSGMENRVKQNIDNRVKSLNMEDYIYETVVPTEDAVEMRKGQRKKVTRVFMPGYVLVRMEMTDESWSTVRHTPSVTGFVGQGQTPAPLDVSEVEHMLTPSVTAQVVASGEAKAGADQEKVEVVDYAVGDQVMVIDGPFAGVHATITEINTHNQRLKADVEILGRETPVDLTFPQIQKVID
ncbi:transcription termination/antitermination protein NusG [Propionibacterium freudenreichii]|uniref:transcription termination/antitermination protein NusG n=1 Tax=Propionibacterium freudenreichii TaxID=1744 RepID=UPI0005439674|nr:transcription termination/antitermination protein NusG [Propionibacterium freudenreichii]CEG98141.1 Transcription antitermination protein NusG [Propionibacterium freudenreichii]